MVKGQSDWVVWFAVVNACEMMMMMMTISILTGLVGFDEDVLEGCDFVLLGVEVF